MTTVPLGRLVEINPLVPEFDDVPDEESITFMPLDACWPDGRADTSRRAAKSAVSNGYTRFRNGDVLLPKITPTFEAGRVFVAELATPVAAGTTELHILRARPGVDSRFVAYVGRSRPFLQEGERRLQGVGNLRRVPPDFIAKFPVQVWSETEQRAIADYLDRETAQIDTLIAKQEQLIATLRERRGSVEAEILSPHSPRPLKSLILSNRPLTYGIVQAGANDPRGVRYIGPSDMQGHTGVQVPEALRRTSNQIALQYQRSAISSGDLIVSIGPAFGKTMLVPNELEGANLTQDTARVAIDDSQAASDYVLRVLRSRVAADFWDAEIAGATFRRLNLNTLAKTPIPLPAREEQHRIVAYLDEQTAKIDALIAKAEQFIALAKERRAALITAAVTGQIDVTVAWSRI